MGFTRGNHASPLWVGSRLSLVAWFGTSGLLGCTSIDVVAIEDRSTLATVEPPGVDANVPTEQADARADADCNGLYCFGFEDALPNSEGVAIETRDGTFTQDCTRSRTGSCSGAATLNASGAVAYLAIDTPASQAQWFVRAYVFVGAELAIDDVAIIHVGTRGGNAGVNVDLHDAERVEVFAIESGQPSFSPAGVTRRDDWMCVLLEVEVSDTSGRAVLRIDGQVVLEEANIDTSPPNGVEFITVGVDWSSSDQTPGTLWFDDVVVSTTRVDCD